MLWRVRPARHTLLHWRHTPIGGIGIGGDRRCRHDRPGRQSSDEQRNWHVTVGLEIHAQLDTPHKLFSRAPNRFGGALNADLAAFDLSLPGSQPRLNTHAVALALRAALAFECDVNLASRFDRKHYFYPDQPAGYQITQHHTALAKDGSLTLLPHDDAGLVPGADGLRVGIVQLQLEQDTGKTVYFDDPPETLVDLNRTGAPLVELVTAPCLPSGKAAAGCLRKVQRILRAVGASEASMEQGGMRCDVNVSVHFDGERPEVVGPARRAEIKNLASARNVADAVDAEAARQAAVVAAGGTIVRETRSYDVGAKRTFAMRTKESGTDYRYMPDPDLPPLTLSQEVLHRIRQGLPELPDAHIQRLMAEPYGLQERDAKVLEGDRHLSALYERLVQLVRASDELRGASAVPVDKVARTCANWLLHEIAGRRRLLFEQSGTQARDLTAEEIAQLVALVLAKQIGGTQAKRVLAALLQGDDRPAAAIASEMGFLQAQAASSPRMSQARGSEPDGGQDAELVSTVQALLDRHPGQAQKLREGDEKLAKWFLGQAMRETKGRARPQAIQAALERLTRM